MRRGPWLLPLRLCAQCALCAVCLLCLLLGSGCPHQRPAAQSQRPKAKAQATLLLKNGVIFPARRADPTDVVEAMALAGDRIVGVGSTAELARLVGPKTRVVDLGGRFVCPGFHDAHLHLESGGRSLATLNLRGIRSLDAVLERIAGEVKQAPRGAWITGRGWDHTLWPGQGWPTRHDLDRVAPDNPIYLSRVDGHSAWVNSSALALSAIDASTADPPGGEISREAGSRRPSGILKEAATELVKPKISGDQSRRYLELALQRARQLGVTSVQDGGSSLAALVALRDAGKLTARVYKWGRLDDDLAKQQRQRQRFPHSDPLLVFGALKGFVDGTLGSGTAALLSPYADEPQTRGIANYAEGKLTDRVRAATRAGFQVALHAIGDRGVRQALRAYEAALGDGGKRLRHRIEHAQLVAPEDLPLFGKLGVIASIQPCHLITDQRWVDRRVGSQRATERGYLWRSLAAQTQLALGTDWSVEPLSPFRNLYAAITRKTIAGRHRSAIPWNAQQQLTIAEAIRAYTYGSAYAAFAEERRGTLQVGKDADFVILDRNLLTATPEQLMMTRVLATVLAGRAVYWAGSPMW